MSNRLARETSPYLKQHADNPVDWYPWGEEALKAAREQDKPILLSIGYSACHWCHVMAHESFEDAEVAARLLAPETRESMSKQGAEPVASTPDQFMAFIKAEMTKWSAVIKTAGLEATQ